MATLAVLIAVGLAFTANAVLRPGCSLLPVTMPADPQGRSQPATLEQACVALGRPLPHSAVLPDGVRETGPHVGTIGEGIPPDSPRSVTVGYTKDGKGIGFLELRKGDAMPVGNVGEINSTVGGVPAIVRQGSIASRNADDVNYLWVRDGLFFVLHLSLTSGMTREMTDAMAASIR